ncbi:LOW QUALITY PROTEIN: Hypothetical protein PHPALM_38165 [Phytophthora palmivora]|uniref:Uncharacterized protein n=1 Tax=Phytophthora palmivora TaxID=4796 RepID=A0A2P4WVL7_9STRA|nr:LOW QUALITY PROTEIN: Hypothetical protein PHPALM_38165 [Phytophthora palmivora]
MAKVNNTGTDYLTHAKELARFAQAWEIEAKRKTWSGASWSTSQKRNSPLSQVRASWTLEGCVSTQGRAAGTGYHTCSKRSLHRTGHRLNLGQRCEPSLGKQEDVARRLDAARGLVQTENRSTSRMKGTLTLRVKACGIQQILKLTNGNYSEDVTFNLL